MKGLARIYLPYYIVEVQPGNRRFYGEVHVSLRVPRFQALVLATPNDLGFEKIPLGGRTAEPLASPEEYARLVEELLEEASKYEAQAFDVGGWKGLIRAMLTGGVKPKPAGLEARLALTYAREVLGIEESSRLRAYPEKLWLPVDVRVTRRSVEAYIPRGRGRERFRVLEKLAEKEPEARRALEELVEASRKPL